MILLADSEGPVQTVQSDWAGTFHICWEIPFFSWLAQMQNTLQSLYNTVHYNTVLDITRFKDGSQKCIDYIEK